MQFKQPVLLITFNRPETTKKILEAIIKIKPIRLYIFSDAPRENNLDDLKLVEDTRLLFQNIDKGTDLKLNLQKKNLGCAKGVTSAINWAFEKEEQLIILEDDCLPASSFFSFADQMLRRYKDVDKVMHISGTRWNPEFTNEHSYIYSSIGHVWGWATWKRAWAKYDYEMIEWRKHLKDIRKAVADSYSIQYWKELFDSISIASNKHTWDYQWQFSIFKENGLCIVPNKNLISNIGLNGTHTNVVGDISQQQQYVFNKPLNVWQYKSSPKKLCQNIYYDRFHMRNHFLRFTKWYIINVKSIKYYLNV